MYHEAHGVQIGTLDQRSRLHSSFRHPEFADGRIEDTTNQMLLFPFLRTCPPALFGIYCVTKLFGANAFPISLKIGALASL